MFEDKERTSLNLLDVRGYKFDSGLIIPPEHYVEQEDETEAIDYLIMEWDYAFERRENINKGG